MESEMSLQEAIEILTNRIKLPEDDTYGGMCEREIQCEAIQMAVNMLKQSHWIKISDKLPTAKDADEYGNLLAKHKAIKQVMTYSLSTIVSNPFDFTEWMPIRYAK